MVTTQATVFKWLWKIYLLSPINDLSSYDFWVGEVKLVECVNSEVIYTDYEPHQ